jgi:microcystin-dependent protein
MADPFLGEIRLMAFGFPPRDWALCDGQILPIDQHMALYSLLGTQFGGDGRTNFTLPDLRSRVPMHPGPGYYTGMMYGYESATLDINTLPVHTHTLLGTSEAGTSNAAANQMLADSGTDFVYAAGSLSEMNPAALTSTGGGQSHPNVQPYETVSFCISLTGTYPSRN